MKLYVAVGEPDHYVQNRISKLEKDFPKVEVRVVGRGEKDFSEADVLLARSLTPDELARADNLRALFVPYTGLNRFPLLELCERGVVVINSHGKAAVVAERALALTLAVMGRVVEMHTAMEREGIWLTRRKWGEEYWSSLYNKRCGFYGMGSIARSIMALLQPFGVQVVGLERDRSKGLAAVYVSDLVELAAASDVLFVCAPLSPQTAGSVGREVLSQMAGRFIVNIARGEIIDEESLFWALTQGELGGAGLDVWYQYPEVGSPEPRFPSRFPIHKLPNVVMSPHAATHAKEFRDGYYSDIFDQLEFFLSHGYPEHQVDLSKLL